MTNFLNSLGKDITGANNLAEALEKAGLNWTAKTSPVEYQADTPDTYYKASAAEVIYKDTDKSVLGVVGNRYGIVQNPEAFAIADALLGLKMEFIRGGQALGQTYLVLRGEPTELLGEQVDNYIVIRNSFDGSCRLQIAWVPVLKGAILGTDHVRVFALKHSANWVKKYGETFVSTLVSDGNQALQAYAESMLRVNYTPEQLTKVLDQFLPLKYNKDGTPNERANKSILEKRAEFSSILGAEDLAQYQGTVYQVYRALHELETRSFQSARVVKPTRAEFKKVKRLFTNSGKADSALSYLNKLING